MASKPLAMLMRSSSCFDFQQAIISVVELVALDIKAGQCQTLPRGFISLFVRDANFAHPFAQGNGASVCLDGCAQPFDGAFRRLILDEKFGVEQRAIDLVNGLGL